MTGGGGWFTMPGGLRFMDMPTADDDEPISETLIKALKLITDFVLPQLLTQDAISNEGMEAHRRNVNTIRSRLLWLWGVFHHIEAAEEPASDKREMQGKQKAWLLAPKLGMGRHPALVPLLLELARKHSPASPHDPSTQAFRGARAAIAAAVQCRMAASMKRGDRRYGLLSQAAAEVADRVKHKRLGENRKGRASRAAFFASLWQQHAKYLAPGSSEKDGASAPSRKGLYAAAVLEEMARTWRLASSASGVPEGPKWPADLEAAKVFTEQAERFEGLALLCLELDAAELKQKGRKSPGSS
jgi:hypothetical protein